MGKAEPGIRRTGSGWQAYVRIGGEFRSKHFKPDTPLEKLRLWREQQKARAVLNLPDTSTESGLSRDVTTYLELVTHLVTFDGRQQQMRWWVQFLGDRPRDTITPLDIRRGLKQLERDGKAPGTRNIYRMALMHFYRTLNGRGGYNPVKDTEHAHEPPLRWTLPSWADAKKAIAAVRDPAHRARLTVLLYTGWPSVQVKRLTAGDIHTQTSTVYLQGRRKGKGTSPVTLPVLPQAMRALQACPRGPWSNASIYIALRRGCLTSELTPFRVYDLRHLFLTTAALAIRDDRVVQALALHHPKAITARYTASSVDARVADGLVLLRRYLKKHFKDT